jgi:hypothetical protein
MTLDALHPFHEIVCLDFEFRADPGERPVPLCLVMRELRSGRLLRRWLTDDPGEPPYSLGPDSLFIAYYASAEVGCHLALNWPVPVRVLDLFTEFRNLTNGLQLPHGNSLLGALTHFGLPGIAAAEKDEMRALALRPGPHTEAERLGLLDYCQTDVDALTALLPVMLPSLDLPRALLRGRYMVAAARTEATGVPIDVGVLARLATRWPALRRKLADAIDPTCEIYTPTGLVVDPRTPSGAAVIETAAEYDVDQFALADAVNFIDRREREIGADFRAALKAAREETGITTAGAGLWEGRGRDHSTIPDFDVQARTIAGRYPALGIGQGYTSEGGYDDTDYAGRLWELLREPDPKLPRKYSPEQLQEAAELVADTPDWRWTGERSFSKRGFASFLALHGIPWPRLDSGELELTDEVFRDMVRLYPRQIGPIRELRHALSLMRLNELAVGADGRNRTLLSAFKTKTGRNAPSNSRFVFGPAVWLRSLIRPERGQGLAYVDWSGQEYGIAAALSGDANMQTDYRSGDPYLAFGKRIGMVPLDATKSTHGAERDRLKVCCGLGAMYGAGEYTVAGVLGVSRSQAREWLLAHHTTYPRYWAWSDGVVNQAMLNGELSTDFGWTLYVTAETQSRTLRNFPMQSSGSELLRLAVCMATERGFQVCCPIHDAILVQAAADDIDVDAAHIASIMRKASELVLPDFPLRTDVKIVRHPDRYSDPRGSEFWERVCTLLAEIEATDGLDVSPYSSSREIGDFVAVSP